MTAVGTIAGLPRRGRSVAGWARPRSTSLQAVGDFAFGASLPALWALRHINRGIEGDARIYMGRALADLDPSGVGRDVMFTLDGQSSFSLFGALAKHVAAATNFATMVDALTVASMVVWFAAAAVLAFAVLPKRLAGLALALLCALPRCYTPWGLIAVGEASAIPRPFAEAGVMLALAAMCRGRFGLAAACLAAAATFHPIMAAPGILVLLAALGFRDRRWFIAAGVAGAAGLMAAAVGLPLAARATTIVDPAWLHLLQIRNTYLFVHLWPASTFGPVATRAATLLIAARWWPRQTRTVFVSAVAVALLCTAASLVLADAIADLLALQVQLWRALWLPAALAPLAAALCLARLPRRGPAGWCILALLAIAWLAPDAPWIGPAAAPAALVVFMGGARLERRVTPVMAGAVALAAIVTIGASVATGVIALQTIVAHTPADAPPGWTYAFGLGLTAVPVILAAYAYWRWPQRRSTQVVVLAGALLSLALLPFVWDQRTAARAKADGAHAKRDLVALLAPRAGEVLWLDGDDSWYWARRPNWAAPVQGGGIVFSRPLALLWHERANALIESKLATSWLVDPTNNAVPTGVAAFDRDRLQRFCARSDAPSWIVSALYPGQVLPRELGAQLWQPKQAHWKLFFLGSDVQWRHYDRYAVIPCRAPVESAAAGAVKKAQSPVL